MTATRSRERHERRERRQTQRPDSHAGADAHASARGGTDTGQTDRALGNRPAMNGVKHESRCVGKRREKESSSFQNEGEARVRRLVDMGEKVFIVALAFPFLFAFARAMPAHPQLILVALSESLAVFFILIRKPGAAVMSPVATLVALTGTALPLMVRPDGTALLPAVLTAALMFIGLSLSVLSKIYLNRSFGVLPANRGIKFGGPYRLARHPMYLGYFVNQIGLLLSCFSLMNVLIYAATWVCQLRRVHEEERQLCKDPEYRKFAARVSYRLIPKLY